MELIFPVDVTLFMVQISIKRLRFFTAVNLRLVLAIFRIPLFLFGSDSALYFSIVPVFYVNGQAS